MNLNYISLGLDYNAYISVNNDLRYDFQKQVEFINDYLSKAIRKHRFKTDGTFNMINVALTEFELKPSSIVPSNVLQVQLSFDKAKYEEAKESDGCEYFLELLETGFKKANELKNIPIDSLLQIIEEFRLGNCTNKWVHKTKRSKEDDLEVILTCVLNSKSFELWLSAYTLTTGKKLVEGIIMKTETGVSIHEGMYKNIIIENDIIVSDKSDSPRVIIDKQALFDGELQFIINGDSEIRKMLSYKL